MQRLVRRLPLVITIITLSAVVLLAAVEGKTLWKMSPGDTKAGKMIPASQDPVYVTQASAAAGSENDKGLWLSIQPTGFVPAEQTIPAGEYFVVVQNSTGLESFALTVRRVNGEQLHDVTMPRFKRRWKQRINLPAGRYVISERDHPEWTCQITVTP